MQRCPKSLATYEVSGLEQLDLVDVFAEGDHLLQGNRVCGLVGQLGYRLVGIEVLRLEETVRVGQAAEPACWTLEGQPRSVGHQ